MELVFSISQDTLDPKHREKLGTFVDEALAFIDNNNLPLDAVAVSGGPGSYTVCVSVFLWQRESAMDVA